MQFREVKNKEEYNKFVAGQKHSQFLQSWEWGEFQTQAGFSILRLGLYNQEELIFTATLIKKKLIVGKFYFYCPRVGIKYLSEENLKLFFEEVLRRAKAENVVFLRFEPRSEFKIKNKELRIKKTLDVQPSQTMILDLQKGEEALLKAMHSKTRYNIRLAERKGVNIENVGIEGFEDFWKIMQGTGTRDNFRVHSKEHYREMLEIKSKDISVKLFVAKYKGKVLAANIISYFGEMVTYVHGSSSNEHRNLMAPYLLQWKVIKDAIEQGYKAYDFHGIGEGSLAGVTRFKKGFHGEEIKYPGVFDIIFNRGFYCFYKVLRRIRRLL